MAILSEGIKIKMSDDIALKTPPVNRAKLSQDYEHRQEVDPADLELMEKRVSEMERYLGIEDMDLAYFYANDGEDLNKKSQMLEDFMRIAEEKSFCMKELYAKYEKMESFLKHNEPFTTQCMELKHKS